MIDDIEFLTAGLLSKWGFSDGDMLEDVLYDWWEAEAPVPSWNDVHEHTVLRRVVREFVIPSLDQVVEAIDIETIHNPIRVLTVDGVDVQVQWTNPAARSCLTPVAVKVPVAEVLRIAAEVHERSWPGFCQACHAPLDPPDLTWCPTCGAGDEDDD